MRHGHKEVWQVLILDKYNLERTNSLKRTLLERKTNPPKFHNGHASNLNFLMNTEGCTAQYLQVDLEKIHGELCKSSGKL